jgi:hypothetical protein
MKLVSEGLGQYSFIDVGKASVMYFSSLFFTEHDKISPIMGNIFL